MSRARINQVTHYFDHLSTDAIQIPYLPDRRINRFVLADQLGLSVKAVEQGPSEILDKLDIFELQGVTYAQLIIQSKSLLIKIRPDLKLSSVETYLSTFKKHLFLLKIDFSSVVELKIFDVRETAKYHPDGLDARKESYLKSILSAFKRVYYVMCLNLYQTDDLRELIKQTIVLHELDLSELPNLLQSSVDQVNKLVSGEQFAEQHNLLERMESELRLPAGTLTRHSKRRSSRKVEPTWWLDVTYESMDKAAKARFKRSVYLMLPKNFSELNASEQYEIFTTAVNKVRNEEHLPEYYKRARNSKMEFKIDSLYNANKILLQEMNSLITFKTALYARGLKRDGSWKLSTANMRRRAIESYIKFLVLRNDPTTPYSGRGIPAEALSLAYIIDSETILDYVDYMYKRAGIYHEGVVNTLTLAQSLLRPEFGWIWQQPELMLRLPTLLQQQIKLQGGWEEACTQSRNILKNALRDIKPQVKPSRDPHERIQPLLDMDSPLSSIIDALKQSKASLKLGGPPTFEDAWLLQKHLLVSLLSCCPLRTKNWTLLTYGSKDVTKDHLQKRDGQWLLRIPTAELKNGYSNPELRELSSVEVELGMLSWMNEHLELLDIFIRDYRPLLTTSNILFTNMEGERTTDISLRHLVGSWTREYISEFSSHTSAVRGVQPFGLHAFRYIIATDFAKRGQYDHAAVMLLDTVETVRKFYSVDPIKNKLRRAYEASNKARQSGIHGII
ncbi:hypothetical protein V3W47_14115 [Deinococcus sp. YIM 134068]|uniref:hypothetical protein n=1 Tax=Deinococcus lichenicola TaxID=3118910 RepID=UPI002F95924A